MPVVGFDGGLSDSFVGEDPVGGKLWEGEGGGAVWGAGEKILQVVPHESWVQPDRGT